MVTWLSLYFTQVTYSIYGKEDISMELAVAIGLGLWFVVMSIAATLRVFKDYKD